MPERDYKDVSLGVAATVVGVTKEPADVAKDPIDGFSPLKAILGAISAAHPDCDVRSP